MEPQSTIPTNLGFVMEAQCIESATTYQIFLSSNPAACEVSFWVGIGKMRRREMIRGDGRCCRHRGSQWERRGALVGYAAAAVAEEGQAAAAVAEARVRTWKVIPCML